MLILKRVRPNVPLHILHPMDHSSSFLRAIPGFGGRSADSELSVKERRYQLHVEKALLSFESLNEWADYIAFLSRLQKALTLGDEPPHSVEWIPCAAQVARKLSLCLSPKLPNGVHQKALSVYESIYVALKPHLLEKSIHLWLPGILPLISYASMQLKPQLLALYKNHILTLDKKTLCIICEPLMLALFAGSDDENSELFPDILALLDLLKEALGDHSHFYHTLFLCIISSPEKRMGALNWCAAKFPKPETDEGAACLAQSDLMVRAFASAIDTRPGLNQANEVVVIRGFFDLLLAHLPLSSKVYDAISASTKEALLMACARVTLRKDMSLNRRLWVYFLGSLDNTDTERSEYFEKYALDTLVHGLLESIRGADITQMVEAFKISHSLIMDQWEISRLVTPKVFTPIIDLCFSDESDSKELVVAAMAFFDGVEAYYIWEHLICNLIMESKLEKLEFILKTFNFVDEELALHIPLAILCLLVCCDISPEAMKMLLLLSDLSQPKLFAPIDGSPVSEITKEVIVSLVTSYYETLKKNETSSFPISGSQLSGLILEHMKRWYVKCLGDSNYAKLSNLFCEFLFTIPKTKNARPFSDGLLVDTVLNIPVFDFGEENQLNLTSVLAFVKMSRYLVRDATTDKRNKMLKIMLSNLWLALVSMHPADHQVEAVRSIFDLDISFSSSHIEAGLIKMLLATPSHQRVSAFYKLWTNSADFNNAGLILARPLHVVLDDLSSENEASAMLARRFVQNVVSDGSAGRLLRLITEPLLSFDFMQKSFKCIGVHDDLKLWGYHATTILNVLQSNEKALKDSFNHEFVVSEGNDKLVLFTENEWAISSYKLLVIAIVQKFLKLELSSEVLHQPAIVSDYLLCVDPCIKLMEVLIVGSESEFSNHITLLIETCTRHIKIEKRLYLVDLIVARFLKALLHFLAVGKVMGVHMIHFGHDAVLVEFIVLGISSCHSAILLEQWFALLTATLGQFSEATFGVILTFNDTIISKVNEFFMCVKEFKYNNETTDVEACLGIALAGLEDMLLIVHSFLITPPNLPVNARNGAVSGEGFLGNVILGVFQIEAPNERTDARNKLFLILLSFQDATRVAFDVWNWAETKPISLHSHASERSVATLAAKLKFRSRKLLECLMGLERQEVIECIIETSHSVASKVKLLHVLDGGRSQVTLPHILNSVVTRKNPQLLADKQRLTMNSSVSEKELLAFLVPYYESIDNDTISEVWDKSIQFLRTVSTNLALYEGLLLKYLEVIEIMAAKLQSERRKSHKDLDDLFMKLLNAVCTQLGDEYKSALHECLASLVKNLLCTVSDADKVSVAVTTIISGLIAPQLKYGSASTTLVNLIAAIGEVHPNRAWKVMVGDVFNDDAFFKSMGDHKLWKVIIAQWASELLKMTDFISRVNPAQQSTANIFLWSELLEVKDRILLIRRMIYLLMVQPRNQYANVIGDLFERVAGVLNGLCPPLYKAEILGLFRAITLRFDELHLLPHWLAITQSLVETFELLLAKTSKELSALSGEELALVLSACKLLDQLLVVGFDEFHLEEWLFITSDPNRFETNALIDQLAATTNTMIAKEEPVGITSKEKPILFGVTEIKHLANLKRFFGSLSYLQYERFYEMTQADLEACHEDLFMDISS